MKQVKRILALILVFCMVCSVLPTVWADDAPAGRTIDFTNPADADKFIIDNQTVSEIREGEGLYMISTNEAIEDCKGQLSGDAANTPRDTLQIPVAGDWTATLSLKVDTSGSNGNYEFLCLYGMADYDNGCGIRAGANSTVNFKEVDGTNESSITGMKVSTGLTSGENHWYRLEKVGTTYTGYLSADGEEFQQVFTYEDTGIEATMIVIDAYSGSSVGYQYWLQSLTLEGGEVEPEPSAGVSIDFTDPADAEKFVVDNQTDSEIREGEGFYMISTNEAIEDCKGQLSGDAANTPRDTIQVPVSGDWTATLALKVDTTGSNGNYEFLCLYGMADYDNGCGIRAGANSTVNFKEVDGVNESSIDGMKVSTGLTSGENHWYRLEKAGTTYTGYLSADGEDFQKVFTYEDTGIEAKMIVIDAYSGRSVGYQYWLQSLNIEAEGGAAAPCEHDYVAVVTEPTCLDGGYTTYTCSKCGDSYVGDEVAALGHDFVDGVCTRCGEADPAFGETVPTIAGITLDGESMEGFEPEKFEYVLNPEDYTAAPVVGVAGNAGGETVLLITGSDFQDPATSYTRSDYARNGDYTVQQERIRTIVGQMQENLGTASYFIGGGDYNFDEIKNSVDRTNTGIAKTLEAVQQVCGEDVDATFIQGNHDAARSNCAPTGPCDKDDFGMFTIMEEDYRSYPQDSGKWSDPQNSEAKAQAVADQLDAYLAEKADAGFDKPVFIACHVPIHYNTRTKNKADAIYGDVIYKTLYKYGDDLNIIFLYGHNHAWGDDDYLGGAANFLTRGDTINIAKHGSRNEFTVEPLNFTYMNYGYTGYYWAKWASSSSQVVINDAADSTLTMTAFQISGNQVIVSRWDEEGMHDLKSVGVASLGLRPEAEVCEPDTRLIESPVTVKAPKNPSTGSGLQITVKQFESLPGVATITCVDPATGASSVYRLSLDSVNVPKADRTALDKAIEDAEKVDKSKYTDETVAALESALAAAKAVPEEADQSAVDAAAEALNAAIAGLQEKPTDCEHDYKVVVTAPTCTEEGYTTYTCSKCGDSYIGDKVAALGHDYQNGVCTRCGEKEPEVPPVNIRNIDFTNPADAEKFVVDNQTVSEIREGEGFYMISTNEAIEDCKGQLSGDAANTPRDTIQVPVAGDWTATLYLKVDTSGSNGQYEFICLYGMADYDNGCGIRAGNGSTVNFKEVNGTNESSTDGMKVQTGLTSGTDHWYRLEKEGTTYTGYISADGETFDKVFTYENTGIEAKMIVIDAYSGRSTGYQYWLQSLTFDGEGPVPCEHDYKAVVTEPTCTEKGFTTYTCSKCGDSYKADEVDALGHNYVDGKCTRCGEADPDYVPPVDRTALDQAIAAAEALKAEDYTPETFAALTEALEAAKAVPADADQAAVDASAKALGDAIAALEPAAGKADKRELAKAIGAAEAIDPEKYESVEDLNKALEAAKAVNDKDDATQDEVDAAAKAVNDAIAALVEKQPPVEEPFRFDDVRNEKSFYFKPVYWAYEAKPQITNGVDKTHFGPDQGCTRGQVVTFLWRAAGQPEPEKAETAFTDVGPKAFYAKAVAWAVEKGITKGMTDTTFAPNDTCTRGQIVTFLYRFKESPAPKSTETAFTDVAPKAFYAKAVAWAVEEGVTKGMTDTTFAPNDTCTRGQVVTFLYRATAE